MSWAWCHAPGNRWRRTGDRRNDCPKGSRYGCPDDGPPGQNRRLSRSMAGSDQAPSVVNACHSCWSPGNPPRTEPRVTPGMAAIKDASRRDDAVAKRPSLTAAIPDVLGSSGQDEETALSRTKKRLRKNTLARFYPLQTARTHPYF